MHPTCEQGGIDMRRGWKWVLAGVLALGGLVGSRGRAEETGEGDRVQRQSIAIEALPQGARAALYKQSHGHKLRFVTKEIKADGSVLYDAQFYTWVNGR